MRGLFYAICAAAVWGMVYTIDQRVLTKLTPLSLLFLDSLLTAVLLLPFVLTRSEPGGVLQLGSVTGRTWVLLSISLGLAALGNMLIFTSIRLVGAPVASSFEIAYPLFILVFSYFVLGTVPRPAVLIGAALMSFGAMLIVRFGGFGA